MVGFRGCWQFCVGGRVQLVVMDMMDLGGCGVIGADDVVCCICESFSTRMTTDPVYNAS